MMYFAAEYSCCIRGYNHFVRHAGIKEWHPWSAGKHFYGAINITKASLDTNTACIQSGVAIAENKRCILLPVITVISSKVTKPCSFLLPSNLSRPIFSFD